MSVSQAATLTTRPLNRLTELDPIERVGFAGTAVGDGSAGSIDVQASFNQDRAFLILWASCNKVSVAATEGGFYFVASRLDEIIAAPTLEHGFLAELITTSVVGPLFVPPPLLFLGNPNAAASTSTITVRFDNSAIGDNLTMTGEALLFDLQTARNSPGQLYWPYRLV